MQMFVLIVIYWKQVVFYLHVDPKFVCGPLMPACIKKHEQTFFKKKHPLQFNVIFKSLLVAMCYNNMHLPARGASTVSVKSLLSTVNNAIRCLSDPESLGCLC